MQDRTASLRTFFARYVAALARASSEIEQAFARIEREPFAGPGPWSVNIPGVGYVATPTDDPAFLYQDTLVALNAAKGVNIGLPSAHAMWLNALNLKAGETVIQVGAGSGYYTAILAQLVAPAGRVHAYEIDSDLAARAKDNTQGLLHVEVLARTGLADDLPKADAVYVCAGITQPSWSWLDALRPGGRLVFPLQGAGALGGMLMITRPEDGANWPARFISNAAFISCDGRQVSEAAKRLNAAYAKAGARDVRSFRRDHPIAGSCWYAGDDWWLSTAEPRA
jgi:protein-L-isoaspartate(D-aspartate) O-methyltransferase